MIWNITREVNSDQQWIEADDGMVTLNIKEYEVRITDSQPDGETNQVFPPQLYPHYRPPTMNFGTGKQVNFNVSGYAGDQGSTNANTQNWGRQRNFGRGSNALYQVAQSRSGITV